MTWNEQAHVLWQIFVRVGMIREKEMKLKR
jgi:hypothetical protein